MASSTLTKRELLVAGYVRNMETECRIKNIPKVISEVIYSFQKFCDEWDDKYSHKNFKIDYVQNMITCTTDGMMTAYGSHKVESGKFTWRLRLKSYTYCKSGAFPPYVGIIRDNDAELKRYENSNGWEDVGYQLSSAPTCFATDGDVAQDYKCSWCKNGDVLEMTLDLDKKLLSFALNGTDYGGAFWDIQEDTYRLAISMLFCQGSEVEIL